MSPRRTDLDIGGLVAAIGHGPASEPAEESGDEAATAALDAAAALLARHGLGRWSMDDVAKAAGMGRATLYRRFATRDQLVSATLTREAQRFFATIAAAVEAVEPIDDKVVEGFLVGMRLSRQSLLAALIASDPAAAAALLHDGSFLSLSRTALVDRYQTLLARPLRARQRTEVELVAEALLRLAVSFFLMPDSTIDLGDTTAARRALNRLIKPLLASSQNA